MNFSYSDDVSAFQESVRGFLEAEQPVERLRDDQASSLWPKLVEIGLIEAASAVGVAALSPLLEEVGRSALPEPVADTAAIALPVLAHLGAEDRWQRGARVAVVHPLAPYANWADRADAILLIDQSRVLWATPGACTLTARRSVDPWRRLFQVSAGDGDTLAEGADACELAAALGAVAAASELLGLADRMIRMATEYAATREQFGQPIGSFQAVKHLLANAQVKLEFARPVVYTPSSYNACARS